MNSVAQRLGRSLAPPLCTTDFLPNHCIHKVLLCCLWTKAWFAAGIASSVPLHWLLTPEDLVMDGPKQASAHFDSSQIRACDPQGFFGEVLKRLPLADAVLHLLSYALNEDFL